MESKKFLPESEIKSVTHGDPIPLNLQVVDGRDDLEVFASLIGPSGERLADNVQLPHFQNGFYASTSLLMPPLRLVFAQYVIKKSGQILTDYEITTELFYGREKPAEPTKWSIGWVSKQKFAEGFAVGYAKKIIS